jgi:hypothetical protein
MKQVKLFLLFFSFIYFNNVAVAEVTLVPDNKQSIGYARSVAYDSSQDLLAVAAIGSKVSVAEVYVYQPCNLPEKWCLLTTIRHNNKIKGSLFGYSMFFADGVLYIGSILDGASKGNIGGLVYIYNIDKQNKRSSLQDILGESVESGNQFGASIWGDNAGNLFVGSPYCDHGIKLDAGCVYQYSQQKSGKFKYIKKIYSSAPNSVGLFGYDIEGDNNKVLISEPGNNMNNTVPGIGRVNYYKLTNGTLHLQNVITSPYNRAFIEFGKSIAISGDLLLISAPYLDMNPISRGSVITYNFSDNDDTWVLGQHITTSFQNQPYRLGGQMLVDRNGGGVCAKFGVPYGRVLNYCFNVDDNKWQKVDDHKVISPNFMNWYHSTLAISNTHGLFMGIPKDDNTGYVKLISHN